MIITVPRNSKCVMYSHWALVTLDCTATLRYLNLTGRRVQIQTLRVHQFASVHLEVIPWSLLPTYLCTSPDTHK